MKIFSFVEKVFILGLTVLSSSITGALKCVSMNNQNCKVRPKIVDIDSNSSMFYPFSIKVNKCSGNCNSINDPYAKLCVPDTIKDSNVRVFNLMSRTNETRQIAWHETCKCICRLDKIICNSKQRWHEDKCRCECKECECECDNSCSIGEYLDYSSCKCRKKLVDPLLEECTENINETKLVNITVKNKNNDRCRSCVVYKVLFGIFFVISSGTIIYIVYHVYVNRIKYNLPY